MEKTEDGTVITGAAMSPQALDTLRSLDSLSYGVLDLQSSSPSSGGGIVGGAGRERPPITRDLIQKGISHLRGGVAQFSSSPLAQAHIISLIAHLHLLLDEFTHAYSAYSQCRRLSPASETDPALFYGLAIIHHCQGQHKHSEEAYRKVLALSPSFPRSGEVHLQLGLLLKRRKSYNEAAAHLETALNKPDPQQDKLLIQFHLANVWELQGQPTQARGTYETLLNTRTISSSLKPKVQKQLGWLLHRSPEVGGEGERERALELLKEASQSKPDCGETWYLLGRVLVTHQKCHEAFAAYQRAIHYPSKVSPANTWHSIGHLYFQMQQPRDSLQAYLCCVYLDLLHIQGWKSLGCLYEAVVYPTEALICYQNAKTALAKKGVRMGKDLDYVRSRLEALNQYLSVVDVKQLPQNPGMPLLHEAWTTLVPIHIRKKRPNPGTPLLTLNQVKSQQYSKPPPTRFSSQSPATYPSPSLTPLLTPTTPGSATNSLGVTGSGYIPTTSPSTNNHSQNGSSSIGAPGNCGGKVKGEDLDLSGINLDSLDFEALAAVASSLPSPASLSARSNVSVSHSEPPTSTVKPHTGASLISLSTPNSGLLSYSNSSSFTLQSLSMAHPSSLPPTPTFSFPSVPLSASAISSSSLFLSPSTTISHNTDTAVSHQNPANWPSYLVKQEDLTNSQSFQTPASAAPAFPWHTTPPHSLPQQSSTHHWSPPLSFPLPPPPPPPPYSAAPSAPPPPPYSSAHSATVPPPPPAPVRSLSLNGEQEKSALRKKRSNSSKSRSRRSSQTHSSSQPRPLLAVQPFYAGFSGIKSENNMCFPPPLPSNMASDPSILSRIQSVAMPGSTPTCLPSPQLLSTRVNCSLLPHQMSTGYTNDAGFDQILSRLASPLSGPSFGWVSCAEVSQTVPMWTTVANNTVNDNSSLFRQNHTMPRADISMTSNNNAIQILTVANNSGHFGKGQTIPPLPTTGLQTTLPVTPNEATSLAAKHTGSLPDPPQEEQQQQQVIKKLRLSPDERGSGTLSKTLSYELTLSPAVSVTQSELLQNLLSVSQPHHLQQPAESTNPPPSTLAPSSSSLPLSSCRPPPPTSSSSSLANQLLETLHQKQSKDGGEGDCSPTESSSSGVSSAGTNSSAFFPTSTAESSPVNPRHLTTSVAPLSPSLPLPPSLPPQNRSTTTASLSHTHSGATDKPKLSPSGSSPRGGSDQNITYTNNNKQTNRGAGESRNKSDDSKLIYPRVPFPSLASLQEYMVLEPDLKPPKQPPFQPGMELRPKCPIYEVTSCEEDEWGRLLEFCNNPNNPICVVRGLVKAIGLDLSLFSSQCLVDTCASHEMEVREQVKQAAEENCDVASGRQVWKCESSKSVTMVAEYARYQQNMLQKEREEGEAAGGCVRETTNGGQDGEREFLSFGTNVDISDENIWSHQLDELNKLPQFLRVTCPETNLLSHIGHTVLGMNSVQLYMKVAGSRTPGHQENNNFCSLNINVGPGTCEWFAVPNSYWGVLHTLCEKHKVNFLIGSWWPVLEELYQHKVPVYRFTQHSGEVVFINPGTIHWVQANSVCNNIAWNTGPLTAHQFRMAWERYQWNKIQKVRSIVPMVHLTWNMARRIRLNDSHFYWQVRSLLESSLAQTNLLVTHLKKAGIPVLWHGRLSGEPAPYCSNCTEEVFNVLFVLSHRGEYLVYCHRCASSMRKTFTVLQQYDIEELKETLAMFSLRLPKM